LQKSSENINFESNKPNCAISSGFAVTYCTNVGLGLAGRPLVGLSIHVQSSCLSLVELSSFQLVQFLLPIVFDEFWPTQKRKKKLNNLWIMYELNRSKKNPFEQKLAHLKIFPDQKLTYWVSFWAQKLTLWP
jgi:hypothetical protein